MNKITQIVVWVMLVFFIWDYSARFGQDEKNEVYVLQDNASKTLSSTSLTPNSYAHIVADVSPKVVSVYGELVNDEPPQYQNWFLNVVPDQNPARPLQASAGSGVIVSDKGHIITNYHVIAESDSVNVKYLGEEIKATVVGYDRGTDLALLKIDKDTQPIRFSDSDKVRVGDVVLAIGNPFNIGETVTQGIVSALRRNLMINPFEDYIQTDAAINTGNSGGPLINTSGELVGINSVIISSSGGFAGVALAISSNLTYDTFMQLIKHGRVVRGYFGVMINQSKDGVIITGIAPNTGAADSDLNIGDKVVEIDGVKIESSLHMVKLTSAYKPQDSVDITVERGGKRYIITVVITERPDIKY